MRNLKRFLAMALTMLMVAGCFSVLSFAFTDDDKIVNYKDEINVLAAMGVVKGQEDGSYNPEGSFTRRQAAIIFARILVGETSAEYENANFKGETNITPFVDLDATGDYYGAIAIANLQGLVIGDGNGNFNPNGTLMVQEILTLAVRALGYDSETMQKGYPASYIIKAKELGLLNGVAGTITSTAVATRGFVAKVVYNMLFDAKTADGKTLVEVKFPGAAVDTVVLTAVKGYNLTGVELPSNTTGGGYVALNALNADGSLDTDTTYFFPWSELDTAGDATLYVGTSYRIITLDNYKTLIAAQKNGRDVLTGTIAAVNSSNKITLGGKSYLNVKKYSTIYNTGATWTGNNEIIMLNATANTATISNLTGTDIFVLTNANGDILEAGTHQVLYYHMPEFWALYETMYGVEVSDGVIVPVYPENIAEDERIAISLDGQTATHPYFEYVKDDADQKLNRYVKVVAYDDNNDGIYDRGIWARYSYGRVVFDGDYRKFSYGAYATSTAIRVHKDKVVVECDGKLATQDKITWYYNPVSGQVFVGKIYTTIGGYLKSFDTTKNQFTVLTAEEYNSNWFGITAAGKTYTALDDKLYGANALEFVVPGGNWTFLEDLIGQYITFIYDEVSGKVVTVFDNADNYYMFDSIISYQFDGFANIRVFNFTTLKYEIIKANTINGYPYYSFQGFGNAGAANEIEGVLEYGDILSVTTDGKGFNNVQTNAYDAFVAAKFYNGGKQLYFEYDGKEWHRDGFPSSKKYTCADGSGALPKYLVIMNEEVGPFVVDLSKSGVGASINFGNGASGKHEILKISDSIWVYTPEMANQLTLGNWIGGNAATTNSVFAQSGVNGGIYDIVYYDGSLNAVSVSAGAANEYAHIWGYYDKDLKDTNGRRMNGFTSFYGNVDENYGMVYSYNSKLEAGFYTLINFNGKIFVGRAIDVTNSEFFAVSYVASRQSFLLNPETGIIENKGTTSGNYVLEIKPTKAQDTVYGVDGASNSSNGFSVIVKGSGVDAIADVVDTTKVFAKKTGVTDVAVLTPAADDDAIMAEVDIVAQTTTVTTKTDMLKLLNGIDGAVTTTTKVENGTVVGVVYAVGEDGKPDTSKKIGDILALATSDADENGFITYTFVVLSGVKEKFDAVEETIYGDGTQSSIGDRLSAGFVVDGTEIDNIEEILTAPAINDGAEGTAKVYDVVYGQYVETLNMVAEATDETTAGIAVFTAEGYEGALYFNVNFDGETTDIVEIFETPERTEKN